MASKSTEEVTKAGITTDENGERVIPASVRADGSVRKELRIRPGYIPPEDVEVYKNRSAQAFRNRGKGGVPGAQFVQSTTPAPGTAAANKNAKRREAARKKAAEAAATKTENSAEPSVGPKSTEPGQAVAEEPPKVVDPEAEKEKEAKKLTKKLRQARELKEKKENGGVLLPEQFNKVIKIQELVRQLESLGFDADGEKKTKS